MQTKQEEPKKPSLKAQKKLKKQTQKEESAKEVYGFFTNQVDVKRFFKQNKQKDDEDDKIQDEFLNPCEFAEIKGFYDDYNYGDLVIQFPNPDFKDGVEQRPVTFKQAEEMFEKILTVMADEGVTKSQMKKERDSFLWAFLTLDDYNKDKEEKLKKQKGKSKKKNVSEKDIKISEKFEKEDIIPKLPQHKVQENSTYKKYLDYRKMLAKHEEELKQNAQLAEEDQLLAKKLPGGLSTMNFNSNKQEDNIAGSDPIKELFKVDLTDTNQFAGVEKNWAYGGYLHIRQAGDNKDYDWICSNSPPKDFLTLMRFTAIAKLSRNGFLHCRQFVTAKGNDIIVVVKSNQEVIMRTAQQQKITKQLELGFADLFSLEPVDKSFRPLRLKKYVRDFAQDEAVKKRLQDFTDGRRADEAPQLRDNESIEEHCRNIYPKVCQWNVTDLRAQVIKKQMQVDIVMKNIAKVMNIDLSHEKVELIQDIPITDDEWQAYYIYMEYIHCFGTRIEELKTQQVQEIIQAQAFLYKLIFRKAMGDANEFWYDRNNSLYRELTNNKTILFTLWDRLDVQPVAPYTEYFQPDASSGLGQAMWRKYQINELEDRSQFINMEKIRITQAIVLKNLNILKMIERQVAVKYFPLHDHFQLKGIAKAPFFTALRENGLMNKRQITKGQETLDWFYTQLKDEAEPTDFDDESLEEEGKFNIRVPWWIPEASLRDYFGEKLALYFLFLSYYTKQLWYMGIIGIIAQGLILAAEKTDRNNMIIIFSICIVIWATFFVEFWKRQQVLFAVTYGQQNFEQDEAERPAFKGQYIRSITNDDLNEEFYSPFKRKMKMLLSLAVSFLVIACVILTVLGIFSLRNQLVDQKFPISIVPSLLNSVQINVFNLIYQNLVMIFNDYENHKILSSYENSLIAKIFIFMFVNNFNSFFIIAFLNSYFGQLSLCKTPSSPDDCFGVLQTQMMTIFIVNFVNQIPVLLVPIAKALFLAKTTEKDENPVVHPFNMIDAAIEEQMSLEPYQTNEEVDGTVNDYMELVIQFSYIALFGLAFPACFIMAFISNTAKIQVNKFKLIRLSVRPFPQGAANIGNWLVIIEVITFLGIFSNAGLIVFTSGTIDESSRVIVFSILLVLFLALKYIIRFLVPDEPESAAILNKRHQYVVDRVVKGFAQSGSKAYTPAKINLKIGGVNYQSQEASIHRDSVSQRRSESQHQLED